MFAGRDILTHWRDWFWSNFGQVSSFFHVHCSRQPRSPTEW